MSKNSTTLLMGGLGNMLFQLATMYSYSLKHNYKPLINFTHTGTLHNGPDVYASNIFRNLEPLSEDVEWSLYEEKDFHYTPIPQFEVDNLIFKGFFQSYKYLDEYKSQIQELFSPDNNTLDYIKSKYSFIFSEPYVSLHVRRGDYLKFSEYHYNLSVDYYLNAIDYFSGSKFLVFSDDIEWCKQHFKGPQFVFVEQETDYVDLYLMSLCTHNIISNSTFSWWAAYLNKNPNKIVVHSDKWFGPKNEVNNIKDLFPTNWVCLSESVPSYEVNLVGNTLSHLVKPNNRYSSIPNKISSYLKLLTNQTRFDGISIFQDDVIETEAYKHIESKYKIGWLLETKEVYPQRYNNFENYKDNYDFILTHNQELLDKYPNNTKFIPFGGCWVRDYNFKVYPKNKLTSMVYSNKQYLTGHKLRHQVAQNLGSHIDLFGLGTNRPIELKEDALIDYHYSIVIENSKTENYFTEKLLDCLAVGTMPIYWGCSNLDKFFNLDGIITFNTLEELNSIISTLTPELYQSKIEAIKENLELSKQYNITEDWIYKNVLLDLK
jgi:hypothetical protein